MTSSSTSATPSGAAASAADSYTKEDCLGCRITGTLTLAGLSTFFMVERSKLPRHDRGQRQWLLICSGAFAAAGIWRATTGMFATETNAPTPAPSTTSTTGQQH